MMRIFSYLVFIISISLPAVSTANVSILFSDVSAGIFRFQVKLAEQGNAEAQYKVGEMYEMGTGVRKNDETALGWFEKSAAQGHKKSGYKLLFLEIESNGLNDYTKARLGKLRQEAASGNSNAQYFLGKMYASGTGVPKSLNNALTWLNKATFNGISEAEHEAIAVEEELARIREREAKKRATALAASKKRKIVEEEKRLKAIRVKEVENQRRADAAKRQSSKEAEAARRSSEQRKLMESERRALTAEKHQLEKERQAIEAQRAIDASKTAAAKEASLVKKTHTKSSFESDPCKGKSARFLSTCR